jgi:hypothetical protein
MKSLRGLVGTVRRGRFPERSQRLSFTCGLLCMCHGSDGVTRVSADWTPARAVPIRCAVDRSPS